MTRAERIPPATLNRRALDLAQTRVCARLAGKEAPGQFDEDIATLSALGTIGLLEVFTRFGLTGLRRDAFLLVAAGELGLNAAQALAEHPLAVDGFATPALLTAVLGFDAAEEVAATAHLRASGLVEARQGEGFAHVGLTLPAHIAVSLMGRMEPSARLVSALVPLVPAGDGAALAGIIARARGTQGSPMPCLMTAKTDVAEGLGAAAFHALGLQAYALDATATDLSEAELAQALNRDLVLLRGGVICTGPAGVLDRLTVPCLTFGTQAPLLRRPVAEVPVPAQTPLRDLRDGVACHALGLSDDPMDVPRRRAASGLSDLAEAITPQATWEDLVLPDAQMSQLRQMAAYRTHKTQVFDDWGFRAKSSRGLGLTALFAGPSGTGKTMAAEIVAKALGPGTGSLGLYRVDLSALVSKYIGETEKNIARIFDAAQGADVVLIFDEGEALFGKRATDIKDSLDKHSNSETAFLLQRLEAFDGIAIVTTNLKGTVDDAFLRRFRVAVDFPFPTAAQRERIWQVIFPAQTPVEGLDYVALGKLALSGGFIRSVAITAAFLAAGSGTPVTMPLIAQAVRQEYGKLGKPLSEAEIRGLAC